ncbi:MAG TPA: hypothetical protein PLX02_15280 [Syntrophorhabdaceae bacterium]|nr:hypothetical protein [Syntrophorhabdaceae bacterium]HQM82966.1 hypothetical protein [Syntrophorhabdaceae bacterium]
MIALNMGLEEAKLLLEVLERYHMHLKVEIRRTYKREFRIALKEREKSLAVIIDRVKNLVK